MCLETHNQRYNPEPGEKLFFRVEEKLQIRTKEQGRQNTQKRRTSSK
jgi:hypothetical protein